MTKHELRKIFKKKRKELSLHSIEKMNDLILINFQKINLPFISCVHTYLAALHLGEVDTANIIKYIEFKNPQLEIAVPKVNIHTETMDHYHITEHTELITNAYGIDEPKEGKRIIEKEIDMVLIPLMAFDTKGNRVGYGKGYYDKFLSKCRPGVIKAGLSFFEPVDKIDDINPFDIKMDFCITPQKLYEF